MSKSPRVKVIGQPNYRSTAEHHFDCPALVQDYKHGRYLPPALPCQLYPPLNDSHSLVDQFTGSGQGQRRERRNLIIEEL